MDLAFAQTSRPRRIMLLGAGPLPSPESRAAPGVANRLWHFAWPLIMAGHDCLAVTLQPDGERENEARLERARECETAGRRWRWLPLAWDHEAAPGGLRELFKEFAGELLVGAGTLIAPNLLGQCRPPAGGPPLWTDLFGDPLAEQQAKWEVRRGAYDGNELGLAWRMLLRVLAGSRSGDHFSSVSRRQRDGLLGQLTLMGKLSVLGPEPIDAFPCCVERLDPPPAIDRAAWLARHGLPKGARVALWSGGFNAWADEATLIAGIEAALRARPELHFVATGGGLTGYLDDVFERCQARVAQSPLRERMHLLGWLPQAEAQAWLAAADVGVIVDRPCAETRFGARNRLLVHAAAGHPIVATHGCEAVDDMAEDGALLGVRSGDPAALGGAIVALLDEPEHAGEMANRARAWCEAQYTFAATAGPLLAWAESATTDESAPAEQPRAMLDYMQSMFEPLTRLPAPAAPPEPKLRRIMRRLTE